MFKHPKLVAIIDSDVAVLRLALALGGLLFGAGLLFSDMRPDTSAYVLMYSTAPKWVWALGFFIYAAGKIYVAIRWPAMSSRLITIPLVTLGLFLWTYVYFSFIADGQSPAEYMMLSLIICEIWIGAHTIIGGKRGN